MKDWLRKHPDVRTIRVAEADLNGQARGKRVPARFADNVVKNGTRFPFSVLNLDIWGEDIDDSPLVKLYELNDEVRSNVTKLNKLASESINDKEALKRIDAARTTYMRALNDKVRELEKAGE